MAEPSWPETVELSEFLPEVQTAQVKLRIPVPVVVLAAELLRGIPRRVGVRNASELIGALLVQAMKDRASLGDLVGNYRETQVHRVLETDATEGARAIPARSDVELS